MVGGLNQLHNWCYDTIYYAFSDNLRNNKKTSIWRKSDITLPIKVKGTHCMILKKDTINPTLVIIGGGSFEPHTDKLDIHWQISIYKILDYNTWLYFSIDFQRVNICKYKYENKLKKCVLILDTKNNKIRKENTVFGYKNSRK